MAARPAPARCAAPPPRMRRRRGERGEPRARPVRARRLPPAMAAPRRPGGVYIARHVTGRAGSAGSVLRRILPESVKKPRSPTRTQLPLTATSPTGAAEPVSECPRAAPQHRPRPRGRSPGRPPRRRHRGPPPGPPPAAAGSNDVFVTSRSDFRAQLRRCQRLLAPGGGPGGGPGELRLHGLGLAVPRTINLALQLQAGAGGALRLHASTSSVPLRAPRARGNRHRDRHGDGDSDGDDGEAPRHNSAIHIRLCREAPCA
ncbi:ribonuclease P protein subunit p20 [Hirundo rustica]|uniref:ribonuclease P protein subunit p20 n=1 Tax=Hirundo rustica TaxID=43150 RepID=UPI002671005C|nr:ribonuclease P protein subunit p20 [Hirundo rustica]